MHGRGMSEEERMNTVRRAGGQKEESEVVIGGSRWDGG